jgi:hypothetical protein
MSKKRQSAEDELRAIADDLEWYEPADPTPRHLCPCCDFVTLPERGNYLICPVCFWEDDGQDLNEADVPSGPNHGLTLREGRANFQRFGACEEAMVEHVASAADRQRFEHRPRSTPDPGTARDRGGG